MDVHAENRGRPHQKVRLPVAPVMGRSFLTAGDPGTRVVGRRFNRSLVHTGVWRGF